MAVPSDQSAPGIIKGSVLTELSTEEVISHWMKYAESHRRTSIEGVKYSFMVESFSRQDFHQSPKTRGALPL